VEAQASEICVSPTSITDTTGVDNFCVGVGVGVGVGAGVGVGVGVGGGMLSAGSVTETVLLFCDLFPAASIA